MRLLGSWGISLGTWGIIIANLLFIGVRAFAWRTGLQVHWLSRSLAPERAHLRKLVLTSDKGIARRAKLYLRMGLLGWTAGILSILLFLWGLLER
jgi:hypothetical protein